MARTCLCLLLAAAVSGCSLPRPPSEGIRAQAEEVRISVAADGSKIRHEEPPTGVGSAMVRGLALGLWRTFEFSLIMTAIVPGGFVIGLGSGLILVPAGVIGGAFTYEDPAVFESARASITRALDRADVAGSFRRCLQEGLERDARVKVAPDRAGGTARARLEVSLRRLRLVQRFSLADANPPQYLQVDVDVVLRDSANGVALHEFALRHEEYSPTLDYAAWGEQDGALFETAVTRAIRELSAKIVEEMFLLRLPGDPR